MHIVNAVFEYEKENGFSPDTLMANQNVLDQIIHPVIIVFDRQLDVRLDDSLKDEELKLGVRHGK